MTVPTTEWVYFAYLENKYAAKGIPYDEEDDAKTRADFDAWLNSITEAAYWKGYGDGQDSMWVG